MKKQIVKKVAALVLTLAMSVAMFSEFPALAAGSTQTAAQTQQVTEKWSADSQFKIPNTIGDLTKEELETAKLSKEDIPEYVSDKEVNEKGHVNRLRDQEPNDNTVIFQNKDGTKTAYIFSDDVKYTDENGQIKDKSTSLSNTGIPSKYKDKYGYVNSNSKVKTYFPKEISSSQGMKLEGEEFNVELIPIGATEKKYVLDNGSVVGAKEYFSKSAIEATVSKINVGANNSKLLQRISAAKTQEIVLTAKKASASKKSIKDEVSDKSKDAVDYEGVFGTETTLRYSATLDGFKEDIILNDNTGVNKFSFRLKTGGLSLVANAGGGFYLADALSGEYVVAIGELVIYDSNGKTENELYDGIYEEYNHHYEVTTVKEDEEYILTVVVDEEFLNSPDTVYPVYVDPTMDAMPKGYIECAAIYSEGSYSASEGLVKVGYDDDYGIGRGLYNFPRWGFEDAYYELLYGSRIHSSELNLYAHAYGNNPSMDNAKNCSLYIFNHSWSDDTVKWSNTQPNGYGSLVSTTSVTSGWTEFDITNVIINILDSYSYQDNFKGLMLKADNESGGTWKKFVTTASEQDELRPYITLTYDTEALVPTDGVENGKLYLIKYDDYSCLDADTVSLIKLEDKDLYDGGQFWYLSWIGNGYYKIITTGVLGPNNGDTDYVLAANNTGGVVLEADTGAINQQWIIRKIDYEEYTIENRFNTDMYLSTNAAGNACLESGSNISPWIFEEIELEEQVQWFWSPKTAKYPADSQAPYVFNFLIESDAIVEDYMTMDMYEAAGALWNGITGNIQVTVQEYDKTTNPTSGINIVVQGEVLSDKKELYGVTSFKVEGNAIINQGIGLNFPIMRRDDLSAQERTFTVAHEMGHIFQLYDMYDINCNVVSMMQKTDGELASYVPSKFDKALLEYRW